MSTVALVVEIRTYPGQRDAFLARLCQHRAKVLANEPGCQRFDILVPEDGADTVVLYEVYEDAAALETHDTQPYFQAYREDTAALIAERRRLICRSVND